MMSSSSRDVASIQCASSNTTTTGCCRARPSSCAFSASSVRSFFRRGPMFGSACRSGAGNASRSARNDPSSSARPACSSSDLQLLQPAGRQVVAGESRCAPELIDEWIQRAVLVIRRAEIAQSKISVLPAGAPPAPRSGVISPGLASPETSTTWPSPALARAQRRSSSSISSSRPTSRVSAEPRKASKRLSTTLSPSTCQTCMGSPWPALSIVPNSTQSNSLPIRRRVAGSIATMSGCADSRTCTARSAASPTISRSPRALPSPRSLMIAMPVAMPIRHRSVAPEPALRVLTAAHNSIPARTACSASCSCAAG